MVSDHYQLSLCVHYDLKVLPHCWCCQWESNTRPGTDVGVFCGHAAWPEPITRRVHHICCLNNEMENNQPEDQLTGSLCINLKSRIYSEGQIKVCKAGSKPRISAAAFHSFVPALLQLSQPVEQRGARHGSRQSQRSTHCPDLKGGHGTL